MNNSSIILHIIIIIIILVLSACATPYYGYSKKEWERLSEEEKQAAQAEYKEIINYKLRRKHEDQFEARKQQIIQRGVEAN
ncbi:hypothetical protein [Kaarinaea lacus]